MARKPSPHRVRQHRVYTAYEASEVLGVHRQTVHRWIKSGGLSADRSARPWLIRGRDLKAFLSARRSSGRTRLAMGELYCLPCRAARIPAERMAEFQMRSASTGQLSGLCPACERMMFRVIRRADLEPTRAILDVTIRQAVASIVGVEDPCVTVNFSEARRTHG